ncbi:MAG: dTMP kinase, partial [Minisyncoccia bacterium]
GPYKTSIFYALDRFDVSKKIKEWLESGYLIVSNRYVASNLGHQGAKIASKSERKKFFNWVLNFEHNILNIPRPNLNIILHLPAKIAQKLVSQKGKREYLLGAKKDIHEADLKYLKQAEKVYLELQKLYPKEFKLVECFLNDKILTPEEIHQKIWQILKNLIK